jgi:hypothetical protein
MIVIIGTKYRTTDLADGYTETAYCANCGYFSTFSEKEVRNWLTLFFIPVFPIGKPRRVMRCERCSSQR